VYQDQHTELGAARKLKQVFDKSPGGNSRLAPGHMAWNGHESAFPR
jgi:hypothetical protein